MKLSVVRWPVFAVLGLALMTMVPQAAAQADDPEAYGDEYATGDYGRLRFIDGGATIVRAGGDDVDDRAVTNAPLFPGDRVGTEGGQRVEIELAGGSVVRLADGSDLTLQSLPRPGAKFHDNTVLLLDRGVLRASVHLSGDDEFRVDTPAGSVYLLGDGDFRIESDGSGRTIVYSRRGVAEVVGEGGSVLVRGGSGTAMRDGAVPDDPQPFRASAGDSFDQWVDERDSATRPIEHHEAAAMPAEELPAEVRPYYRELSAYGRWVNVPSYGWAWSPYSAGPDWRPYYDGSWSYGPSGYFWVGSEPWGWAPYRYGRWSWLDGYGWFWCPGHVFSGAWVSWSWGSLYVGWAPLNYWGYPAYIGSPYHYGHYDPHCWTFVDYDHIASHDVHRHAVPIARAEGDVRGRPAVTRAPRISPDRLNTSREWRERAAREAASDPRIRVGAAGDSATPTARSLRDVEARLTARNARTAVNRDTAMPRGDIRTRPAPRSVPNRATAPSRSNNVESSSAPANGAAPGKRAAPINRDTRPATGTLPRERMIAPPRSSAQPEGVAPERQVHQPLPRRYAVDPRNDRRTDPRRDERADPSGGQSQDRSEAARQQEKPQENGRELAPRGTNERVRALYERLSRTGEMQRAPARGSDDGASRAAPPPTRPAPQRVEPSRGSQRSQPREARPEVRPAPRPAPAPARPAPKPEHAQGDSKRSRR